MPVIKGERAKKVRDRFNMSAPDWAKLIGVSPSTVYRWEAGGMNNIDTFQYDLIDVLAELPKQDLSAVARRTPPLELLWQLLGQAYGKKD